VDGNEHFLLRFGAFRRGFWGEFFVVSPDGIEFTASTARRGIQRTRADKFPDSPVKIMTKYTGPIEPILLSVSQVAHMIGFGRTKTYELIQSGKIPSVLVEGRLRVKRQALDDWIAQCRHSTAHTSARDW
jgi:excisionase family DNA binding protein